MAPPLPGQKEGGYLLCEIVGTCFRRSLSPPGLCLRLTTLSRRVVTAVVDNAKVYSLDRAQSSVQDNRRLTLKHGKAEKTQQMDIISNDAVTQVRSSLATPSHTPCASEVEEKTD